MESNILTAVFLPLALAIIMLGMGLSLTVQDFKRVYLYPKAVFIGLGNQLVVLPLIAFGLVYLFGLKAELAVGIIILAACPGGATSNLISHLAKGDTALSITLTAISSMVTIITIPLLVNLALFQFMAEGADIRLPVLQTILQIFLITVLPVSIGMIINKKRPSLALSADKPVRILSAVFLFLIIAAALIKEREHILDHFREAGPVALTLNVITLAIGYITARALGVSLTQSRTISIESGIQNGTLAIGVAATLLNNPAMTIPAAIYSLIMFMTAGVLIFYANRFVVDVPETTANKSI